MRPRLWSSERSLAIAELQNDYVIRNDNDDNDDHDNDHENADKDDDDLS